MRRHWILLVIVLFITGCGDEKITGEAVAEPEDGITVEKVIGSIEEIVRQVPKDLTPEQLIVYLEEAQQEVFKERSELFIEKREVLDIINDKSTNFEDQQFYMKALGLINARASYLTTEATVLESRIKSLKKRFESGDLLVALENTFGRA